VWLLLHGVPLGPKVWAQVSPKLSGDVVAPDLIDLITEAPPKGVLQQHLAEAVLARLPGDDDIVVVGHSFGGQVALEVALAAPQRVSRLIIVCSRHTPYPAFAAGAHAVGAGEPVDIDAGMRRWFTSAELAADGAAVRYARQAIATTPRPPWAAALAAIADYDRSASVGAMTVPTRLFAAGHDEVSPPAVMAALAAALPGAVLEVVPGWAHMSPFVDPAAFAARLTWASSPDAAR
jgi:pimeloyl-ACP methyl ester carboxylesterase